MNVPFVDLQENYQQIQDDVDNRMRQVIEKTAFIGGDDVQRFERNFADYIGTDECVGVASGTDAIYLSLRALGIGDGDEVITVSHTFTSTVDGIVHAGARPRFCDIDPETYTMEVNDVERLVTDRTAAIMPVHLYGHPVDMGPILDIADDHDLAVIEDASQAHGATHRGTPVGQIGDVACFSHYPSKNLGAFGDAGSVATDDKQIADEVRALREYGETEKYKHERIGYNSRLDTLQAAVLDVKLRHLDDWNEARRQAANLYAEQLTDLPLKTPSTPERGEHVFHLFVVETADKSERTALQAHLNEADVSTGIHYPIPVHEQPSYRNLQWDFDDLPATERVTRRILSLPIYPEITDEQVAYVCSTVRSFYDGADHSS